MMNTDRTLEPSAGPPAQAARRRAFGLVALGLLLCCIASGAVADVQAFLGQARAYEGDTVRLTIEASGLSPGGEPDVAPLDQDFEVQGSSTSRQTQIINGRRSDKTSWQISLLPRRVGALTIPPLRVGSETTEPLTLQVDPIPEGGLGHPGDKVWIEVELEGDADGLVVQQQVPLVVRAYSVKPLIDYRLEVPSLDGAVLTQIGRDSGHLITRAGQQYRVIERRFTLNPERSGALRIPPITFAAELESEPAGRALPGRGLSDLFDDPMLERMLGRLGSGPGFSMFERGEPARARSEALQLEVSPSPDGFSGEHWLPATELRIEDSWRPADGGKLPKLAVGEPTSRTLTLVAKGLSGSQIPEIEVTAPEGFRVYTESTEADTRSDGETVIGISRQRVTMIPTSGGDFEMPAITVPWWDTEAGKERTARVPALSVTVAGPVAARPPEVDAASGAGIGGQAGRSTNVAPSATSAEESSGAGLSYWLWIAVAIGVIAALMLVSAVIHRRNRARTSSLLADATATRRARASQLERDLKRNLQQACEQNDPQSAARALMEWAGYRWPEDPPQGLGALAARCEPQRAVIQRLEQRLYGSHGGQDVWDGNTLWSAFKDGLRKSGAQETSAATRSDQELAPLYPRQAQQS
jgi:hypothetical protein